MTFLCIESPVLLAQVYSVYYSPKCNLSFVKQFSSAGCAAGPSWTESLFCVFSLWAPAEVAAGCNNVPQDLKIDQNASHDHPAYILNFAESQRHTHRAY